MIQWRNGQWTSRGFGLIPGVVGHFDSSNGFRVPHIGSNALHTVKDSEILDDIGNLHVYFVHSYHAWREPCSSYEIGKVFSGIYFVPKVSMKLKACPVNVPKDMQQLQPTAGSICFVKTDRLKRGLQSMGSSDYPMGEIISGENSREVDEVAARQCEHALL